MDKLIYLGVAIFELSMLHMYETFFDKIQPYFRKEKKQLHYMDYDSFVLSLKTENVLKGLKNVDNVFDFSNLNKNHEFFSNRNEKLIGYFKIEIPKNFWMDEFIALRSKLYAFKGGDDDEKKLKGDFKSQSRNVKFEEHKNG